MDGFLYLMNQWIFVCVCVCMIECSVRACMDEFYFILLSGIVFIVLNTYKSVSSHLLWNDFIRLWKNIIILWNYYRFSKKNTKKNSGECMSIGVTKVWLVSIFLSPTVLFKVIDSKKKTRERKKNCDVKPLWYSIRHGNNIERRHNYHKNNVQRKWFENSATAANICRTGACIARTAAYRNS